MNQSNSQSPRIEMIATDLLDPNSYNFNEMSAEEFAELKEEVRHLGGPAKPIVVRRIGSRYEIADGEHSWWGCKELGIQTVPCEVCEMSDFEARRQTYKRNKHGRNNPLRLGRAFDQMRRTLGGEDKSSIRQLAKEIQVPASTIRLHLNYVEAAKLRNGCAPETADEDIARLSRKQLALYRSLPESIRDKWLDAGADVHVFDGFHWCRDQVIGELCLVDLDGYVGSMDDLRPSLELLVPLCVWWNENGQSNCLKPYLAPVAEMKLPAWTLDLLPCRQDKGQLVVLLEPNDWTSILHNAAKRNPNPAGLMGLVQSGVRLALGQAGHDVDDVVGPEIAEKLLVVQQGPEFIRAADFLTFEEQFQLATVGGGAAEEEVLAAKAAVCDCLRAARTDAAASKKRRISRRMPAAESIVDLFLEQLGRIRQMAQDQREAELFADRALLEEQLVAKLVMTADIPDGLVAGRDFGKCLAARLHRLENPEFALLASYVLTNSDDETAIFRWLKQVLIAQQERKSQVNNKA